jgi:tRNA U34 5-methylaminomethyl-2-thiouridine-forming methyltransferase MnmC
MSLSWTEDGAPRSGVFDDIYFQPGEGLDESRAVFLQGCGLPDAWRGRESWRPKASDWSATSARAARTLSAAHATPRTHTYPRTRS